MSVQMHANAVSRESTSSRALASLLLAGGVSALVVLADQLMDQWADSHELAAWLVLWGIAVLAILLLRGLTRLLASKAMTGLDAWSASLARRRADERLWSMAQTDPRMMADLQCALDHSDEASANGEPSPSRAARIVRGRLHYI